MSKRLTSTFLLFAIGVGFAIFSFTSFINASASDDKIQALLYAIPALAAFFALALLPFRHDQQDQSE